MEKPTEIGYSISQCFSSTFFQVFPSFLKCREAWAPNAYTHVVHLVSPAFQMAGFDFARNLMWNITHAVISITRQHLKCPTSWHLYDMIHRKYFQCNGSLYREWVCNLNWLEEIRKVWPVSINVYTNFTIDVTINVCLLFRLKFCATQTNQIQ